MDTLISENCTWRFMCESTWHWCQVKLYDTYWQSFSLNLSKIESLIRWMLQLMVCLYYWCFLHRACDIFIDAVMINVFFFFSLIAFQCSETFSWMTNSVKEKCWKGSHLYARSDSLRGKCHRWQTGEESHCNYTCILGLRKDNEQRSNKSDSFKSGAIRK